MIERMIDGYQAAFSADAQGTDSDIAVPKLARTAIREAAGRSWKHLADERIEGLEPAIPLGTRFCIDLGRKHQVNSL